MALQASMNIESPLWRWLQEVRYEYRSCPSNFHSGRVLESPFGACGVMAHAEDDWEGTSEYIVIGFNLPIGVYAEVDDGTYGQMQGFRIYLDPDDE